MEPHERSIVLSVEHLSRIIEALDSAVEFATEEARRIKNAPESDGYDEEDVRYAAQYLVSITEARGAIEPTIRAAIAADSTHFEAVGYAAYSTSETAAPGANADVQAAIAGMPVGGRGVAIMEAFTRGWNRAASEAADAVLKEG